jgi:hypothetical protein
MQQNGARRQGGDGILKDLAKESIRHPPSLKHPHSLQSFVLFVVAF